MIRITSALRKIFSTRARVEKIFLSALLSRVKSKLSLESKRRVGAFTDSVDPGGFVVRELPDYIFLCGGKLDDLDHSLRANFNERITKTDPTLQHKIQLAEAAFKWYQSGKLYDDLLELEEFVAGLSACILLFVESPGAIAELGVFSQTPSLNEKLIVVIEEFHYGQPSFIRNGPIERIRQKKPENLLSYPWLVASSDVVDPAIKDQTLDAVIEALRNALDKRTKTCKFQAKDHGAPNHGHLMLLIADLVKLCAVSLQSEIQKILEGLGISIKKGVLSKYLYLLDQLGLIHARPYGHYIYYFSPPGSPDHIVYAAKGLNGTTDRARLRELLRKDFPSDKDKERVNAGYRRQAGKVTP